MTAAGTPITVGMFRAISKNATKLPVGTVD